MAANSSTLLDVSNLIRLRRVSKFSHKICKVRNENLFFRGSLDGCGVLGRNLEVWGGHEPNRATIVITEGGRILAQFDTNGNRIKRKSVSPWEGIEQLPQQEFGFLSDLRHGKTIDLADSAKKLEPERIRVLCTPERLISALKASILYGRETAFRKTVADLGIVFPPTT